MNAIVKRERISTRVSTAVAKTLNEAADLSGATPSDFVVQASLKEVRRVIASEPGNRQADPL